MPINLLGDEDKKKELTPQKQEQVSREMEITPPSEEGALDREEKGAGISAFFKKKDKGPEPKSEEKVPAFAATPRLVIASRPPNTDHEAISNPLVTPSESPEHKSESWKDKRAKEQKIPQKDQSPGGFDISLMPSRLMVIPRAVRSSFLVFIAALVVTVTIFSLVLLYTNWHFEKIGLSVHKTRGEIQLLEAKSTFYLETRDEIDGLEKKAARVESILNNHIYWTKFFTLLEYYTIPDVYFGDFSANVSGSIHLDIVAKDLTSLAKQLVSFKTSQDFVENADVSGIRKIPDGIAAAFDLNLVDDVFYK